MTDSAVLFIVFNRPDTTEKVLRRIIEAQPRKIYVAGDGARTEKELLAVNKTRKLVEKLTNELEREFLWREENLGCKRGVIGAINWFFENEDSGIILEDDCLPDPGFFSFCERALDQYSDREEIMHIAGSNLLIRGGNADDPVYFSRLPNIWGWATWKEAWEKYDPEMREFEEFINGNRLKDIIQDENLRKRYIRLFKKIKNGVDTWDFQWTYTNIMNDGLSVIPNANLISNIGFGNNATHSIDPENPLANLPLEGLSFDKLPKETQIDREAEKKFLEITNKIPPLLLRILNKFKKVRNKLFARG